MYQDESYTLSLRKFTVCWHSTRTTQLEKRDLCQWSNWHSSVSLVSLSHWCVIRASITESAVLEVSWLTQFKDVRRIDGMAHSCRVSRRLSKSWWTRVAPRSCFDACEKGHEFKVHYWSVIVRIQVQPKQIKSCGDLEAYIFFIECCSGTQGKQKCENLKILSTAMPVFFKTCKQATATADNLQFYPGCHLK